ncbi:MAG: hypothetical protein AB1758_02815 [Candidatus Eremiobacterota bacterium]
MPTVRRSFALPSQLIEDVMAAAPEMRGNLNAVVKAALQEYVDRRRTMAFEASLVEMARDPQIQTLCRQLDVEFRATELDGLSEP